MAESLISIVLEQLASITGVEEEAKNLTSNLQAIQAVLKDAEERHLKEKTVKNWLDKLKEVSYDIDDVLDEWNTSILKRQIEKEESRATNVPLPKNVSSQSSPDFPAMEKLKTSLKISSSLDWSDPDPCKWTHVGCTNNNPGLQDPNTRPKYYRYPSS
ncbi:hypothetical protein PTKIN_Ptkin17bG0127200 [Pterospermum kingtungense]